MSALDTLVCTNRCVIEVNHDPGASGNVCPKCGNGALVAEDSALAEDN